MNKKKLMVFSMIGIFALALVAAGYVVHSLTIKVDVLEPFSNIEYSIIGDAGNWNGVDECGNLIESEWQTYDSEVPIEVGGLYAGEGRKFCVRITNEAEAPITYTVSNIVRGSDGSWNQTCVDAFGENTLPGEVPKKEGGVAGVKIDGLGIVVPESAKPVTDCLITVNVARG